MISTLLWAIVLSGAPAHPLVREPGLEHTQAGPAVVTPVRAVRKNTLGIEVGLNTLVGAGLQYSRSLNPHLNLETGVGLSFQSVKAGLRLRANFSAAEFTPFVAAGLMIGSGTAGTQVTSDRGNPIAYRVLPSPFVQGTFGCAWTTRSGFSMLAGVGWAQLLRANNVVVTRGTPTANQMERLAFSAGSGPTGALTMGYSF